MSDHLRATTLLAGDGLRVEDVVCSAGPETHRPRRYAAASCWPTSGPGASACGPSVGRTSSSRADSWSARRATSTPVPTSTGAATAACPSISRPSWWTGSAVSARRPGAPEGSHPSRAGDAGRAGPGGGRGWHRRRPGGGSTAPGRSLPPPRPGSPAGLGAAARRTAGGRWTRRSGSRRTPRSRCASGRSRAGRGSAPSTSCASSGGCSG